MLIEDDLFKMTQAQLTKLAKKMGIPSYTQYKGNELIFKMLEFQAAQEGLAFVTGCLEIMDDGFGFLRFPNNSYLPGRDDVYVSLTQIRRRAQKWSHGFRPRALSQRRRKILCSTTGRSRELYVTL